MKSPKTPDHRESIESENFLRRLHRRKVMARQGVELPEEALPDGPLPDTKDEAASTAGDEAHEKLLTDADMPPVDSLQADSDFSGFLSPGVSDSLQRAALRKLWQVADIDFTDDLDIYASDYTQFEPLGGLVTQEMRHRIELETRRQAEAGSDDSLEAPATPPIQTASNSDPKSAADEPDDVLAQAPTEAAIMPDNNEDNPK